MSSSQPKFFPIDSVPPMKQMPSVSKASTSIEDFHKVLEKSTRIMALCGAGLSAASGLGTFRGAGGLWRNYQATSLATPQAFKKDPGLVWLFYSYRRHMALQAKPNAGHYALTELSKKLPEFITLTQNVDETPPTIPVDDLPKCPECKTGLLRPGVVWFGEALPEDTIEEIDTWIAEKRVDLCLVIGTTATVHPAAGYVEEARQAGARIVVINMDSEELGAASGLRKGDFLFEGDASTILPDILKPIIGDLDLKGGVKDGADT
ncbi:NAD-dependent protein deacylase sirtuin-5, mitochondrial [Lachnellula hyalina]|uniref:NAD-dependent protein deacylase sirtuin-5, mitochondrial n=1 Tax=Lachnellula hyalina TaxID=1316788 RepID=A0A8H8QZC8_9HELO|nr:NAD-dependent protein deacylase sirtuin-5, mitochondrial [Lachnellula hyalina]TVY25563.1 NAD-dependent protein deacylase sirtuin-5, mitochondrial [Lachnellula hyalina]